MRLPYLAGLASFRMHIRLACFLLIAGAGTSGASGIRADVLAWLLAHNPGLDANFVKTELPDRAILLPDGRTVPLYKIQQFHDSNFHLTFYARKKEGVAIVSSMEAKLRKLMALPEFYHWIRSYRGEYRINGKKVSSMGAYNYFRNIHRRLGVAAGKQYHAPVGGGSGIGAPSWAVWRQMNIFFHEACHCIGIGHNSGGLSGPLAGKLRDWDHQKRWNYATIDLNTLSVPPPTPPQAPAPDAPGLVTFDGAILVDGELNPTGPAPRSMTLVSIDAKGNPPETVYAIRLDGSPVGDWLRLVPGGPPADRDDAYADGAEAEWHTAAEWAGKRLRGLLPGITYAFQAKAKLGLEESNLVAAGEASTSLDCDVNRSGAATLLDYAYIRAVVVGGAGDLVWPCDVNDDAAVDVQDLSRTRARILNP